MATATSGGISMIKYICDICGQEIKPRGYKNQMVKLEYEVFDSLVYDNRHEIRVRHVHKKCLNVPFDLGE